MNAFLVLISVTTTRHVQTAMAPTCARAISAIPETDLTVLITMNVLFKPIIVILTLNVLTLMGHFTVTA